MEANSTGNRVQVFARVRPVVAGERAQAVPWTQVSQATRAVHVLGENLEVQQFVFDGVFPPEATQEDVFAEVGRPILCEGMEGFNGTIFAYGQTGSGKTHSLLHRGDEASENGLLPRLVQELFEGIAADPTSAYEVEAAAMQVYNESVDDLLHERHRTGGGHNLSVQSNGDVPGLTWEPCQTAEDLSESFARAHCNLVYVETKMNKASSRSHAILQIKITKRSQEGSMCGRLSIVDLAGSECVKKSGVEGVHFLEAAAINKSLLALGNMVSAMGAKKRHVPFRDSKLTQVLSPCIGDNCKTVLLLCASPSKEHAYETLSSLKFASRAMQIDVNARVNRLLDIHTESVLKQEAASHESEEQGTTSQKLATARITMSQAVARAEEADLKAALAEQRADQAQARFLLAEETIKELQIAATTRQLQLEEALKEKESLREMLATRSLDLPQSSNVSQAASGLEVQVLQEEVHRSSQAGIVEDLEHEKRRLVSIIAQQRQALVERDALVERLEQEKRDLANTQKEHQAHELQLGSSRLSSSFLASSPVQRQPPRSLHKKNADDSQGLPSLMRNANSSGNRSVPMPQKSPSMSNRIGRDTPPPPGSPGVPNYRCKQGKQTPPSSKSPSRHSRSMQGKENPPPPKSPLPNYRAMQGKQTPPPPRSPLQSASAPFLASPSPSRRRPPSYGRTPSMPCR